MDQPLHARLLNAGGELIAEGPCRVDESAGTAMLEAIRQPGYLLKERGLLVLELESGRSLRVSDRPIVHRLQRSKNNDDVQSRRMVYRLRLVNDAQEATAAGVVGEGTPVPERETPAAR